MPTSAPPSASSPAPLTPPRTPVVAVATVGQLADLWAGHAMATYLKHGRVTSTALVISRVRDLLHELGQADRPLNEVSGAWLMGYRAELARVMHGQLCRYTINAYTKCLRLMFRFGLSWGFVSSEAVAQLDAVPPLRKGRPPYPGYPIPTESRQRRDEVPYAWVSATRPFLSRTLRGMIALQLLTAARPNEICHIRPCDLRDDRRTGVTIYTVPAEANKTDHVDGDAGTREVVIGPKAMRVLRAFWPERDDEYFFSPRRTERDRHTARGDARATPRWPSHDPELRAAKRSRRRGRSGSLSPQPGEHYTRDSYRRAIERASARAAEAEAACGVPASFRTGTWSPYQLRHRGASSLTEAGMPLHVLQQVMGHSDIATTMRYVHTRDREVRGQVRRLG